MNDDTRFLLRRIEALEGRLSVKIDELMAFKNKALGVVLAISFVGGGIGATMVKLISQLL